MYLKKVAHSQFLELMKSIFSKMITVLFTLINQKVNIFKQSLLKFKVMLLEFLENHKQKVFILKLDIQELFPDIL